MYTEKEYQDQEEYVLYEDENNTGKLVMPPFLKKYKKQLNTSFKTLDELDAVEPQPRLDTPSPAKQNGSPNRSPSSTKKEIQNHIDDLMKELKSQKVVTTYEMGQLKNRVRKLQFMIQEVHTQAQESFDRVLELRHRDAQRVMDVSLLHNELKDENLDDRDSETSSSSSSTNNDSLPPADMDQEAALNKSTLTEQEKCRRLLKWIELKNEDLEVAKSRTLEWEHRLTQAKKDQEASLIDIQMKREALHANIAVQREQMVEFEYERAMLEEKNGENLLAIKKTIEHTNARLTSIAKRYLK
mmetsp:Transcript_6058/g.8820  ORF Transcript_6058/g.8820 Transcript_6058/m.8820 type:complete len:299 (-) Transcript_6058:2065-2961(-)